jgi:hypothetical protein
MFPERISGLGRRVEVCISDIIALPISSINDECQLREKVAKRDISKNARAYLPERAFIPFQQSIHDVLAGFRLGHGKGPQQSKEQGIERLKGWI